MSRLLGEWFALGDARDRPQAQMAAVVGRDPSQVTRWRKKVRNGETPRLPARTIAQIEQDVARMKDAKLEGEFQGGIRLSVERLEERLEELRRLLPTPSPLDDLDDATRAREADDIDREGTAEKHD